MNPVQRNLIVILVICALLLHLALLGLGLTHNLFYLFSLGCCLYTLIFTAYHLVIQSQQPIVASHQIHVVVVQALEPNPNPLLAKAMDRM